MKKHLFVLTFEEARDQLVDFYVNLLADDRAHTRDLICDPKGIGQAVPAVMSLDPEHLADLFADLCHLGDKILDDNPDVNTVAIQMPNGLLQIVAENDNAPKSLFKRILEEIAISATGLEIVNMSRPMREIACLLFREGFLVKQDNNTYKRTCDEA